MPGEKALIQPGQWVVFTHVQVLPSWKARCRVAWSPVTTLADGLRYWRMPRQRRWLSTNVPIPEAHVGLISIALVMGLLWPRRVVPERSLRGLG